MSEAKREASPFREKPEEPPERPAALSLRSVSMTFGGLRAVGGVSFEVPERSIFGLIGPNGAGKTTVFNLITGVYKPGRGRRHHLRRP